MEIQPLDGKYYGTNIYEDSGPLKGLSMTLWHNTGNPSDRQLTEWGFTREQWDNNEVVDDGWGGKCPIRGVGLLDDGHYESRETYEFAIKICQIANKE